MPLERGVGVDHVDAHVHTAFLSKPDMALPGLAQMEPAPAPEGEAEDDEAEEPGSPYYETFEEAEADVMLALSRQEQLEQAREDMEHGTLRLAGYMEALGGTRPPFAESTETMLDAWTGLYAHLVARHRIR